ncbi:hypothetical protein ASD11_08740 [Aeromicrobium sp. Root495]|nr:hypothetical protein ASD11_08740 [Aeromicrobium sp. Root495]
MSAPTLARLLGELESDQSAYREITERIRLLMVDGRLTDGTRLPSERELAAALGVSRTTTARVYSELRDAGLVMSRRGSGSVVRVPLGQAATSSLIITPDDADTIALTYSAPAGAPGLGRAFERAVSRLSSVIGTPGYLPDGLPVLREALAQHYADRGLPTDPSQIIVTNGAIGSISLLARTFLRPGERVLVEGLSYPHGHEAFTAVGGRLAPLPVGDRPWDLEALRAQLAGGRHRMAYFIPEFHNPTAAVMTDEERSAWARELRRHDVLPIVDESLHAVNLDGVELPAPFACYDDRAILVGSSSKPFWGGLRVGWMRVPHDLVLPLVQARMSVDLGSSAFDQYVVTELLTEGGQTAAAGRAILRTARDHLLGELARELPEISAPCPAGGLNLWVTLPGRDSSRLTAAAAQHGLLLTAGPRFYAQATAAGERHLRLAYTQPLDTLTEAVRRLAAAYDDVRSGRPSVPGRSPALDLIA